MGIIQVYRTVSATIDHFYWSIMTRQQSKAAIEKISTVMGEKSTEDEKQFSLNEVNCTLKQLSEIRNILLESGTLRNDMFERSLYIEDIPYLTDDKEQLLEECKTYFKRVAGKDLQELVSGIKGDIRKAIAVFRTEEGMYCLALFVSLQYNFS